MRVDRRHRGKPIPRSDLDALATFRAELTVYGKLRDGGASHEDATRAAFAEESRAADPEVR